MRNDIQARAYLADAQIIMEEASASEKKGHFHRAVRKSQEVAFYGSPDGRPAASLYTKDDGEEAIEKAKWVLKYVKEVI